MNAGRGRLIASALVAAAALEAPAPVTAQAASQADARAVVEQRIALTAQLLGDGTAVQRIVASRNARAASHLDEGRLHHAMSQDALARGDLVAARTAADEALRHLGLARRLAPDAPARQAAARQRHEQMLANLERLLEAWRGQLPPNDLGDDGDRVAAIGLVGTARWMAGEGRHEESVHVLASAESHVLAGMNRLLQRPAAREVDYTERAATPDDEFRLELRRHLALADLVPLAVNELKPRPDAAALITRYGETSRTLREQAVQRQQGGDAVQALAQLRNATMYLQRALAAAGVATPAPIGETP